jgi:hypothetical protein
MNGQGLLIMSQASAMTLPAPSGRRVSSVNGFSLLLVINGVALALTGFVQSMFDLGGHFLNKGPLGPSLHGNLDALAFFEAHGLAVIIGVLLVLHRNAPDARWHWIASATHILLGGANLMFWPIFSQYDLVPMGIVATAMHMFFAAVQFAAAGLRTPGLASGPGSAFKAVTLFTLAIGFLLHASALVLGREVFVQRIFTPTFDMLFAIPMTFAGVAGWVLLKRAKFSAAWEKVAYFAMLIYFTTSIALHLRTFATWDTSYVLAFPDWYSVPILWLFVLMSVFTIRLRFE